MESFFDMGARGDGIGHRFRAHRARLQPNHNPRRPERQDTLPPGSAKRSQFSGGCLCVGVAWLQWVTVETGVKIELASFCRIGFVLGLGEVSGTCRLTVL